MATTPTFNPWVGLPALTIVAHGGQGKARRTLEIDAVRQPNPPLPSGAIYTEADSTKFNGTAFLISGLDHLQNSFLCFQGLRLPLKQVSFQLLIDLLLEVVH